jgi:selenocysteine-specific elongation factor
MPVIGTAGHVDHGKSALVEALTGRNPDRLKEEQARGMTIDLGFGCLNLPDGRQVGVVDVPGHTDFLENMLTGMWGMDLILFVIAANEGIRPQTREHLAIIDLLKLPGGVVVLTKADLVKDDAWWRMLEDDVCQLVSSTVLESAPIIRFSAVSGSGRAELLEAISDQLDQRDNTTMTSRPRLAVDRAFHLPGFGPVVTGTLQGGKFSTGMEVSIQPGNRMTRIRGLQSYHQLVEEAQPGSRTAVNLAGIHLDEIHRGDVVTLPGMYPAASLISTRIDLLAGANKPLKHLDEVKFFCGTAGVMALIRLLEEETIPPGGSGLAQIEFEQEICVDSRDRFIIRRPSPAETIGGGIVIEASGSRRARRHDQQLLIQLSAELNGSREDRLYQWLRGRPPQSITDWTSAPFIGDELERLTDHLLADGRLEQLAEGFFATRKDMEELSGRVVEQVRRFHDRYPLRLGMRVDEAGQAVQLDRSQMAALVEWMKNIRLLVLDEGLLRLPDHHIRYSRNQEKAISTLLEQYAAAPFHGPQFKETVDLLGEEVLGSLFDAGRLIRLDQDVIMRSEDFEQCKSSVLDRVNADGQISLAQVRDLFSTSRKYAQAILEYLDRQGVTIRDGEWHRRLYR